MNCTIRQRLCQKKLKRVLVFVFERGASFECQFSCRGKKNPKKFHYFSDLEIKVSMAYRLSGKQNYRHPFRIRERGICVHDSVQRSPGVHWTIGRALSDNMVYCLFVPNVSTSSVSLNQSPCLPARLGKCLISRAPVQIASEPRP